MTEKSFPKAVTASPEFTSLAKAFLSEIAPNFKCSVCESRNFLIVERLSSEYRPTIDFYSVKSSKWKDLLHGCAFAIIAAIHTHSRIGVCVSGKIEPRKMSPALRLVSSISDEDLEEDMMEAERDPASGGSGGGTTSDDLLRRVQSLEEGHKTILSKLDGISDGIQATRFENERRYGGIEGRLQGIEKMLDAKLNKADLTPIETKLTAIGAAIDTRASLSDLNLIWGKVDSLPTTLHLLGFAITVFAAAGISRYFLH